MIDDIYQKWVVLHKFNDWFYRTKAWLSWNNLIGKTFTVPWPTGYIVLESGEDLLSADPNDLYRPLLEELVGKQGRDWQWGSSVLSGTQAVHLKIKLRYGKTKLIPFFILKWG